jgi:hypothetical protein
MKHVAEFPVRNDCEARRCFIDILFNFALEYAIRRVRENQDGLKLHGTHHPLIYADINKLGGSVRTKEKNTETSC